MESTGEIINGQIKLNLLKLANLIRKNNLLTYNYIYLLKSKYI